MTTRLAVRDPVSGADLVGRIDRVLYSAAGALLSSFWNSGPDRFMLGLS